MNDLRYGNMWNFELWRTGRRKKYKLLGNRYVGFALIGVVVGIGIGIDARG